MMYTYRLSARGRSLKTKGKDASAECRGGKAHLVPVEFKSQLMTPVTAGEAIEIMR